MQNYLHTVGDYISTPSRFNPEISLEGMLGKEQADALRAKRWFTEGLVDTISTNAYSFIAATAIDTIFAKLDPYAWLASRSQGLLVNTLIGAPYGKYRNFLYRLTRTTPESKSIRKSAIDFLAFNTFHTPLYGGIVAVATMLSEGAMDMHKVGNGMLSLAILSPFIGPTMGWTQDKARELCGFQTAAEKATGKPLSPAS